MIKILFVIFSFRADLLYAFFAQWLTEDGMKGFVVTATDSSVDYKKYNTADGQKIVCKIVKDWEVFGVQQIIELNAFFAGPHHG